MNIPTPPASVLEFSYMKLYSSIWVLNFDLSLVSEIAIISGIYQVELATPIVFQNFYLSYVY